MSTLTNTEIRNTYDALLKLADNGNLTTVLKEITDGLGNVTPLSISQIAVKSSVAVEASGFKTPTGTSAQFLRADGSVGSGALDSNYEHDQTAASSVWTISHGLNKKAGAVVVDSAGSVVVGDIVYVDNNNLTITFNSSFSGYAYLN